MDYRPQKIAASPSLQELARKRRNRLPRELERQSKAYAAGIGKNHSEAA